MSVHRPRLWPAVISSLDSIQSLDGSLLLGQRNRRSLAEPMGRTRGPGRAPPPPASFWRLDLSRGGRVGQRRRA